YLNVLPKLVSDYNNSVHSVTGMKPIDVNTSNEMFLFNKLNYKTKSNVKVKYKVGDQVRVLLNRSVFHKGYTGLWSPEVFVINRI
uniref:hypothetical protein n=1 Tax=Bradyrhizobium sp. 33ap4 TaxID=3061630 RepID=UPI00292CF1CF